MAIYTHFPCGDFDLLCQMGKLDETMCSVDDNTIVSHKVQTYDGPCQNLHQDKMFCKEWSSMSNLSVVVDIVFSKWPSAA